MNQSGNKPRTILEFIFLNRRSSCLLTFISFEMVRGKKGGQGLILIELLIAMAIFAIGVITIFSLFISATQGVIIGLEKTRGFLLSNETLEAALSISKSDPDYLTPGKYEVGVNNNNHWVLIPKTGLMGHFLLANNIKDSSPYKNQTTMNQISFFEDRKGEPLGAARFNGIDSYIKTEYAFSLQIEGPLTLAVWVLDTGVEEKVRTIASKGTYKLSEEGGEYFFTISGPEGVDFISADSDYLPWEYIAGVYDPGGQPTLRLYINGKEKASKKTNITSINNLPEIEFFIGAEPGQSNFWQGLISDLRVYNRSLTTNEIEGLYGSYSAPYEKSLIVSDLDRLVGIWSFNEGEGCIAHDNSGNNNHGLIKNCSPTQWVESRQGKPGRSFNFEGNNYIEIADSPTLKVKNEISISLWIKMPEELPGQDMTIFHKRAAGSEDYSFSLIYQGAEKGFGWAVAAGAPDQLNQVKLTGAAIPDRWQHLVVTFDGTNKKMYIDNREIIDLEESSINNPGADSRLFIGRNAIGVAIDDLRIYNKILTPEERKAIFLGKTNYYLE